MASQPLGLLDLPAELRELVYEFYFAEGVSTEFIVTEDVYKFPSPTGGSLNSVALLSTCRQINEEASPLLCRWATFTLRIWEYDYEPDAFLGIRRWTNLGRVETCNFLTKARFARVAVNIGPLHMDVNRYCSRIDKVLHQLGQGKPILSWRLDFRLYSTEAPEICILDRFGNVKIPGGGVVEIHCDTIMQELPECMVDLSVDINGYCVTKVTRPEAIEHEESEIEDESEI